MSFEDYMSIAIIGTSAGFMAVTVFSFVSLLISILIGFFRKI